MQVHYRCAKGIKTLTTQNELLLEHRVSELELELHHLRKQVERLAAAPPQPAAAPPAKRHPAPGERTVIHEKRAYDFFAKLPPVRKVIDLQATNTATGETVRTDGYSLAQLTRACQQFSRLQFPNRRAGWKGNRWLYGIAKNLFAQHGAIVQHPGSRKWSWVIWPHERRALCARIVDGLSRKK